MSITYIDSLLAKKLDWSKRLCKQKRTKGNARCLEKPGKYDIMIAREPEGARSLLANGEYTILAGQSHAKKKAKMKMEETIYVGI